MKSKSLGCFGKQNGTQNCIVDKTQALRHVPGERKFISTGPDANWMEVLGQAVILELLSLCSFFNIISPKAKN